MDVSVIIPVFDGEKTLKELFKGIVSNLGENLKYEILFVFDQGHDESWRILKELKSEHTDKIKLYKLKRNYGQHNAILMGIKESSGEIIITMDEDLQHDPGLLKEMILNQKMTGCDVVYCKFRTTDHSLLREIASALLRFFLKSTIHGLEYYSSFRLIRRNIAQKLLVMKSSYTFIDARLAVLKPEICYIDVDRKGISSRESTYGLFKLLSHAIQIILEYTSVIKWMFFISFLLFAASILMSFTEESNRSVFFILLCSAGFLLLSAISAATFKHREYRINSFPELSNEKD